MPATLPVVSPDCLTCGMSNSLFPASPWCASCTLVYHDRQNLKWARVLALGTLWFLGGCSKHMMVSVHGISTTMVNPNQVIVLAGQSNMVFMEQFEIDAIRSRLVAAGLGTSSLTLIPCAISGTSISDWQRGGRAYQPCLEAVAGRHVDGMLFWQGENDAMGLAGAVPASQYGQYFLKFIDNFAWDVHGHFRIAYVRLGEVSPLYFPGWSVLQHEQDASQGPDRVAIHIDDIPPHPGDVHYDAYNYKPISERLVDAYLGSS